MTTCQSIVKSCLQGHDEHNYSNLHPELYDTGKEGDGNIEEKGEEKK